VTQGISSGQRTLSISHACGVAPDESFELLTFKHEANLEPSAYQGFVLRSE